MIMKIWFFIILIILPFATGTTVLADRQLSRTEILEIFQTLTAQPGRTWIAAGTIEAIHLEYKASKGYIVEKTEIVKYDGDKFYWEINANSITGHAAASQNTFEMDWNKNRIFTWDGEKYTMYARSSKYVIVKESPSDTPAIVNGPLTAGVVPWGNGIYTYENLSTGESSAMEVQVDGAKQVHLTLKKADMPEIVLILDSAKDYAVLSCSINYNGSASKIQTYDDYQQVSGKWIPTAITIDRYDNTKQIPELVSHDDWDILSVSTASPGTNSFRVAYEVDTQVEYHSSIVDKPLYYRQSDRVNTDSLLCDRLINISAADEYKQNCATAVMKYVSRQLGKDVTEQKLTELINEPNEGTSLYELQKFAQELDLHCLAVKTDLASLKDLNGCKAILHLLKPDHYVVLEYIDNKYVWITDLDRNKFFYRMGIDEFNPDWREGTALLVSNEPLEFTGSFTQLSDEQLGKIVGGAPTFSCNLIRPQGLFDGCVKIAGGSICTLVYREYAALLACEPNSLGGSCHGQAVYDSAESPCINKVDSDNPNICDVTGEWYLRYTRGCIP